MFIKNSMPVSIKHTQLSDNLGLDLHSEQVYVMYLISLSFKVLLHKRDYFLELLFIFPLTAKQGK